MKENVEIWWDFFEGKKYLTNKTEEKMHKGGEEAKEKNKLWRKKREDLTYN